MSVVKIAKLSQWERHLLSLVDELSFANRLHIPVQTVQLWRRFGMPSVVVSRKHYYNSSAVFEWLESQYRGGIKNGERLWAITPKHLRPRSVVIKKDLDEFIPAGKYFIIPIE